MSSITYAPSETTAHQAQGLAEQQLTLVHRRYCRLFAVLLALEFIAGIILAYFVSPRTWAGLDNRIHPHVWIALSLGFVIVSLPIAFAIRWPTATLSRHIIAAGQLLIAGLLIHLTGGRIETHFLIFGSLAFLAFFLDWKILLTASLVTAADHILRGQFWPESIYGTAWAGSWRWLEHTWWVAFEVTFLAVACTQSLRQIQAQSSRQAELRDSREMLEHRVADRTAELRRVNEEMSRTQALLETVLQSSLMGVVAFESVRDAAGKIADFRYLLVNAAAEKLIGKTQDSLKGRTLLDVFPGMKAEGLFDAYVNVVETGVPLRREHHYSHDGLSGWFEDSVARLVKSDGFALTFTDISARKEGERELQQAKETAEAATRSKTDFLANMSHEIRTPITAIVGFADMMLDPGQTVSDWHDNLLTIRRNARHLLDLINDVLDISKIEAGLMTVEKIPCDLPAMLTNVMSLMRARAAEKGLTLTLSLDTPIPRQIVTDSLRLRQILMNLVNNAVKFTHKGGIELRVAYETARAGGEARFQIIDTGIGMTEDQVNRLFQPFIQADSSTTRQYGGTGLGLTISRRLAGLLDGDLVVRSQPGHGSTFEVRIVADRTDRAPWVNTIDEATTEQAAGAPALRLNGRILLAEDGKDNQRFISAMLRMAGAEVVIAENGRIAVDLATGGHFDLIFMDMQMPQMDGYQAASVLRAKGHTLPIIALTAHALSDDRAKCLQAGCTEYLTKPIDRHQLIKVAHEYLTLYPHAPASHEGRQAPDAPAEGEPLISTFKNDPAMKAILAEFIQDLPNEVRNLEAFLAQDDMENLRQAAHQLKGAGGSYGFQVITEAAKMVENSIRSAAPTERIQRETNALIQLIRRIEGYTPLAETPHESP